MAKKHKDSGDAVVAIEEKIPDISSRIKSLVNVLATETGEGTEALTMQQFNAQFQHFQDDAPACDICGSITVRNGTCYKCFNCGNSMGCS